MSNLTTAKVKHQSSRPQGCNRLATSRNADDLRYAADVGNRATRRTAQRNLRRLEKKGAASVR